MFKASAPKKNKPLLMHASHFPTTNNAPMSTPNKETNTSLKAIYTLLRLQRIPQSRQIMLKGKKTPTLPTFHVRFLFTANILTVIPNEDRQEQKAYLTKTTNRKTLLFFFADSAQTLNICSPLVGAVTRIQRHAFLDLPCILFVFSVNRRW